MKKFFTVIPLQLEGQLASYKYRADGNSKLQMESRTRFPIVCAINGYATAGERVRVIAVVQDTAAAHSNLELLREELSTLSADCELVPVEVPDDESITTHTATFQKLIDLAEDNDELFACMTYGTKPLSEAVRMAVQYAYRIKENASVRCIVYGLIRRPGPDRDSWYGEIHDMTALIQVDEIVRLLADRKVSDPKKAIDAILSE